MISTKGAFLDQGRCELLSDAKAWKHSFWNIGCMTHGEVSVKRTALMADEQIKFCFDATSFSPLVCGYDLEI